MKVIGLTGRARAGKDTVAEMIGEALPEKVVCRQGFADTLKVSAARALGLNPAVAVGLMDELKVSGWIDVTIERGPDEYVEARLTGRKFLQLYGTEAHRDVFGQDFWLDAVLPMRDGKLARHDADVLVIPDVRFENEAERVIRCGGEVWEIVRPGDDDAPGHASERGISADLIDVQMANAGTLGDLRESVECALNVWQMFA